MKRAKTGKCEILSNFDSSKDFFSCMRISADFYNFLTADNPYNRPENIVFRFAGKFLRMNQEKMPLGYKKHKFFTSVEEYRKEVREKFEKEQEKKEKKENPSEGDDESRLIWPPEKYFYVRRLSFCTSMFEDLENLYINYFPNLKDVTVDLAFSYWVTDRQLRGLTDVCVNYGLDIRRLHLNWQTPWDHHVHRAQFTPDALDYVCLSEKLKEMEIGSGSENVFNDDMMSGFRNYSGRLIVPQNCPVTDAGMRNLSNLSSLDISSVSVTEAGLLELQNVEDLTLRQFTATASSSGLHNCRNLKRLTLHSIRGTVGPNGYLPDAEGLEELNLVSCNNLSDRDIYEAVGVLKGLRILRLENLQGISKSVLPRILHVQKLEIRKCRHLEMTKREKSKFNEKRGSKGLKELLVFEVGAMDEAERREEARRMEEVRRREEAGRRIEEARRARYVIRRDPCLIQ